MHTKRHMLNVFGCFELYCMCYKLVCNGCYKPTFSITFLEAEILDFLWGTDMKVITQ